MEVQPLTDPIYDGWWGECILHSNEEGIYHKLNIAESLQRRIIELDLWVKEGEQVHSFTGANEAIGTIIIRCESSEELHKYIEHIDEYVRVCVK